MLNLGAADARSEMDDRVVMGAIEPDRRKEGRHVALLRVGVLHARGNRDLCIVRNISTSGLSARAYCKVVDGDEVHIEFKSGGLLSGKVAWARDWNLGIAFPDPIDVEAVLASRWVLDAHRRRNLPRIQLFCDGRLKIGTRNIAIDVLDVSQGGARVRVDGPLDLGPGLLCLPGLAPLAGVLRWVAANQAGFSFNECVPFEQLARWIHSRQS